MLSGVGVPYGSMENVALGGTNWPRQVSEPLYIWGYTLNGTVTGGESDYPNIQSGRDFINGTVKPGYTPYTYPHPLTVVSNTSTNTSTNSPIPPTNLHIILPIEVIP